MRNKKHLKNAINEAVIIQDYARIMEHDYITIHVNKLINHLHKIEEKKEDWPQEF